MASETKYLKAFPYRESDDWAKDIVAVTTPIKGFNEFAVQYHMKGDDRTLSVYQMYDISKSPYYEEITKEEAEELLGKEL